MLKITKLMFLSIVSEIKIKNYFKIIQELENYCSNQKIQKYLIKMKKNGFTIIRLPAYYMPSLKKDLKLFTNSFIGYEQNMYIITKGIKFDNKTEEVILIKTYVLNLVIPLLFFISIFPIVFLVLIPNFTIQLLVFFLVIYIVSFIVGILSFRYSVRILSDHHYFLKSIIESTSKNN